MTSIDMDHGDLIDLDSGTCVPVEAPASPVELPQVSLEEQEHLLDVCPPKLEQKLSLTRKQELVRDESDDGNVLVTLGHDKLVPIRRRIDVVSSDTIRRLRDITRNLERVIRKTEEDVVDNGVREEDETFETREIDNAFYFLSQLEDSEEQEEARNLEEQEDGSRLDESVSSDGPLMDDEAFSSLKSLELAMDEETFYPLEPIYFVEDPSNGVDEVREAERTSRYLDANDRTCVARDDDVHLDIENPAFEASPGSKSTLCRSSRSIRPLSVDCDDGHVAKKPLMSSPITCTFDNVRMRGEESANILAYSREDPCRRSHQRFQRKSWSESVRHGNAEVGKFGRSISVDVEYICGPSTSDGTSQRRSSLSVGLPETSSDYSSECSEVDWSWVEEVECSTDSRRAENEEEEEGQEGDPTTMSATEARRMRDATVRAGDSNRSVAMSVAATGKSLPSGSPGPPASLSMTTTTTTSTNVNSANNSNCNSGAANGNSWVRASMRRLRHLRLPEAERDERTRNFEDTALTISAPNSLPDIALIAPEILAAQTNGTSVPLRPSSAPAPSRNVGNGSVASPRRGRRPTSRSRGRSQGSRRSSVSRATASDTTCSSSSGSPTGTSPASSATTTPQHANGSSRRICERQRGADRDDERDEDDDEDENPLGRWPHALSPALACLGCTLGLFNISRFAILSIQFGANFIVQFLVLSLILGIPLLTLQVCLGQRLAAGAVDMWKISPLFQGVGIALLTAQAFIGIYSIVGVSWMFVYFRDSFITKQDRYRWAESFLLYREDTRPTHNGTSYKLHETVPDYFSGAVLQRHHLNEPDPGVVTLKFQVAFNLAVVWMIVFVSLSKGLRSYGKVVYVFTLVPVFGTLVLCTKLLGLTPTGSIHQLFPATVWSEFFINGKSWVAASSEVFLTWGLLGSAAMQIAAHNKHKHLLQRDTSLVVVLTFVVLLLSAFLANTCVQILRSHGYVYTTSSFERISGYTFMRLVNQPAPPGYSSTPERFMSHASFLVGQRVLRPGADLSIESGYQVLRLSTELVPATLALLGTEQVSPFWAVLFYFILILFGIAQQLAIWHCVITGIMAINTKMMKLWETTITFFSCACAYILGLPMATELGIYVVYYLDYTIGGGWWIMVLYLVQVGAVFAVRGRPHTGEAVVAELFPPTGRCLRHWAGPLLSFTWNVILPVTLMVLSITVFKSSGFRELYTYRKTSRDYWSVWARQLGAAIQLIPILMIPAVAIIQTCRYLNSGPPDIFDNEQMEINVSHCEQCNGRIQLLYRPSLEPEDPRDAQTQIGNDTSTSIHGNGILSSTTDIPFEDPPPKYTPPPSYTTATGARIAKMLRQSFRRSVRRIANVLGEGSGPRPRPSLQPPPPDYATVLVEMNQSVSSRDISVHVSEPIPDVTDTRRGRINEMDRHRPNTIDRTTRISTIDRSAVERTHSTMDRSRRPHNNPGSSNLTAADVANLLRSSIRRGTARTQQTLRRSFANEESTGAASVENLVEAAAPIGQDSLVYPKDVSLVSEQDDDNDDDKKTADEIECSVSVI
ncbi:uncharacterized protein LOC107269926 isoform X2 [Cephus cinctus]|uniref:Uncharacterized protein LOC107269926 isoform X2 n=1 Tax=Cephus cinctus TaxID=211228 RepID=A0AAJ7C1R2_CEPCN|nr:uncharacterized protein LOC107269926 isoform X2 [Cephus cinctus]